MSTYILLSGGIVKEKKKFLPHPPQSPLEDDDPPLLPDFPPPLFPDLPLPLLPDLPDDDE